MDTKDLVEYIRQNGIDYDVDFTNVEKEGCIDEYSSLFKRVLTDIEKYVVYGVNNSFTGDLKSAISRLTKTAVRISEEKNAKRNSKYLAEVERTEKEVDKQIASNNHEETMSEKVIRYVDSYIKGTRTLIELNMGGNRRDILESSIVKLEEIKSTLSKVCDVSTETALTFAKDILAKLKVWASQTSILMHNNATLAMLDDVKAEATQWKASREVVKQKGLFVKGNKALSLSELDFIPDDMYMISKSTDVYNDVMYFEDNLKEYRQSVSEGRFGTGKLEDELKEKHEEANGLNKEKNELVARFQNKEISSHQLYSECKDIDADLKDLNNEIDEIRKEIEKNKSSLRIYNRVFRKLERISKVVLSYKSEPVMLSYIGGMIDFARISRVMHGTGTAEDINHVVDINTTNIDINNHTKECYSKLIDAINNIEETEERIEETSNILTEQDIKEQEKKKAEEDEYLKNLLGNYETPASNTEETNKIDSILSDIEK